MNGNGPQNSDVVPYGQGQQDQVFGLAGMSSLPKLDGKNYQSWKEMQEIALEIKGLKKAITDDGVDQMMNLRAKLILLESMDESHRAQVRGCSTAKAIFERLRLIYNDKSAANIYRLLHQYYRYDKVDTDSMSEHIGRMDEMRNKLADLNEEVSEAVYQVTLIGSLPQEYASVMETWELTHQEMRTTERLVSILLKREQDIKKASSRAFLTPAQTGKNNGGRPPLVCYYCKKEGHMKKHCPELPAKKKEEEGKNKKQDSGESPGNQINNVASSNIVRAEVNFAVNSSNNEILKNMWVCDSGASSHMCNNSKWFEKLQLKNLGKCYMGDNKEYAIEGSGTIKCEALVEGEWQPIRLTNVLYVPVLAANLISVGQAGENEIITTFSRDRVVMSAGGLPVATGTRLKGGLYLMDMKAKSLDPRAFLSSTTSFADFHKILGHAGADRIKKLLHILGIKTDDQIVDCPDCPGGKGKHASHPMTGRKAGEPGCVHIDLSGIVNKPNSLEGFKYYMLCKDEWSEFDFIYFCKEKSEVPTLIGRLIVDFEHLSGKQIREIHSDQGSEFKNKITELLFLKEKIKHVTSTAYCPQQNGRIEREIQTITNQARTMLNASGLTKELWPQALECAVHIKNRLPTSSSDQTPNERLTGVKPTVDHLVEFGRQAHIIVNDHYLTKWDSRTVQGHVVGFTRRRNTYKVYLPSTNKVVQSCDVILASHKQCAEEQQSAGGKESSSISYLDTSSTVSAAADRRQSPVYYNDSWIATAERNSQSSLDAVDKAGHDRTSGSTDRSMAAACVCEQCLESRRVSSKEQEAYATPTVNSHVEVATSPFVKQLITGPKLDEFFDEFRKGDKLVEENQYEELGHPISSTPRPSAPPPPPPAPGLESKTPGDEPTYKNDDIDTIVNQTFLVKAMQAGDIPRNYTEALRTDVRDEWVAAISAELEAHKENETWTVCDKPRDKRVLTTKWVFNLKRDSQGNIERFKARLVARGFEQRPGVDFYESFAPVARLDSIRLLLALCAIRGWKLKQFDVSTAFLNGTLQEEVYVHVPPGVNADKNKCLKLNKALYGLRQAPRAWNSVFDKKMRAMDFRATRTDGCVYINKKRTVIVAIYVDDGLVLSDNDAEAQQVIDDLKGSFKLKQLDGSLFLGLEIERKDDEDTIAISQKRYIRHMLERFNLSDANGVTSPLVHAKELLKEETSGEQETSAPFREAIGCLQYLACGSRPDILFAVNFLSSFNNHPRERHWTAVKRVLRYLKSTIDLTINYSRANSVEISAFSDADYGNDNELRRSTSGTMVLISGGLVIFSSRKQSAIAQSSTEAEYIAACEAAKEIKWLAQFLNELGVQIISSALLVDNHSTIAQIKNNETKRKSKHVDIKYHFVRQEYLNNLFELKYIESSNQAADLLTKPLSGQQILKLVGSCNMKMQGKMAVAALLAVAVVTSGVVLGEEPEVSVRTGGYVVQIDSVYEVVDRMERAEGFIKVPELCKSNSVQGDSVYDVKKKAYDRLQQLCDKAYEDVIRALQRLVACMPGDTKEKALARSKRFVFDPTILVYLGVYFAVTWATSTAIEYLDPQSATNVAKRAEDENRRQDRDHRAAHQEFVEAKANREQMARQIEVVTNRSRDNQEALMQAPEIHTSVAFEAARLLTRMSELKRAFLDVSDSCRRGRVNVRALGDYLGVKWLHGVQEEHTELKEVTLVHNSTIFLDAQWKVISKHAKILRQVGVSHWANYTEKPKFVKYDGPEFVIVNATANCTRGVEEPATTTTYLTCDEKDYRDPELDKWTALDLGPGQVANESKPVVIETKNSNFVYCLYHKISVNGSAQLPCPVRPMLLPKNTSWELSTHKFTAITIYGGQATEDHGLGIEPLRMWTLNSEVAIQDAKMIKAIFDGNNSTVQAGRFSFDKGTITIPTDWSSVGYSLVGLLASIITISSCCVCVFNKIRGTTGREQHSEQINIINELPEAPVGSQASTLRIDDRRQHEAIEFGQAQRLAQLEWVMRAMLPTAIMSQASPDVEPLRSLAERPQRPMSPPPLPPRHF